MSCKADSGFHFPSIPRLQPFRRSIARRPLRPSHPVHPLKCSSHGIWCWHSVVCPALTRLLLSADVSCQSPAECCRIRRRFEAQFSFPPLRAQEHPSKTAPSSPSSQKTSASTIRLPESQSTMSVNSKRAHFLRLVLTAGAPFHADGPAKLALLSIN
jgi:hypothetical protein